MRHVRARSAALVWAHAHARVHVHACARGSAARSPAGLRGGRFLSLRFTGWVHGDRQPFWLTPLRRKQGPRGIGKCGTPPGRHSALYPPGPGHGPRLDDKLHPHVGLVQLRQREHRGSYLPPHWPHNQGSLVPACCGKQRTKAWGC